MPSRPETVRERREIVFRAACGPAVGTGHLRRCMTLAEELAGREHRVRLLVDDTPLARQLTDSTAIRIDYVSPTRLHAGGMDATAVFVIDVPADSGGLLSDVRVLADVASLDAVGVNVVSLGHMTRTSAHFRAVIDLYPSRGVHAANYHEGPDYLILRREFESVAPRATTESPTLFVSMGGSDPHDLTRAALAALAEIPFTGSVHVVTGEGYPEARRAALLEQEADMPFTLTVHHEIDDIRDVMRQADAGLVAFGTTAYELMSQRIPVAAVTHYRWQEPSAHLFEALGCCEYLGCAQDGITASSMAARLRALLADAERLEALARRGREVVDGKGAARVADLIEDFVDEGESRGVDVLYVLAHPGDELLGCGGTLLAQIDAGQRVALLILGEGVSSRRGEAESGTATLAARREIRSALQTVVDEIGVPTWYYYQFADNRFDTHDLLDLVKVVESVCRRHRPKVVYTHHPGDLNIDHRRTFEATVTALRPLAAQAAYRLFSIEVPSSTDWGVASGTDRFAPNWFEDITGWLDRKLELARLYATEIREDPHPRSLPALRERARQWGRQCGLEAAEAFVLQRHVERKTPQETVPSHDA